VSGFFTAVAIWIVGGWLGAQVAAFFNRGSKLKFWGRLWSGVLGGVILGWVLDKATFLKPITDFLHAGHVEDVLAGVIGGFIFGVIGGLFSGKQKQSEDA